MTHCDRPRPGRLTVAGALLVAGLLAAGCSSPPEDAAPADPHGFAVPGQPTSAASGAPEGEPQPDPAEASATEAPAARADQRAVGAAAERAASFGFTHQVTATDAEIDRTREETRLRQTNSSGTTVDPAGCKAPLTAVDWSPILVPGADASRLDFGSEGFAGTGSIEVAALEDPAVLERHLANVERLVEQCPELRMTVTDENLQESSYDLTARTPDADGEGVESSLVWTRTPAGGGDETTAQVLIGRAGDHVAMVSFIGRPEVAGDEFTTMAEEVLAAALGTL
ncbi:MAG TPA: hypothetical protein VIG75_10115 [Citricoccus sp.]